MEERVVDPFIIILTGTRAVGSHVDRLLLILYATLLGNGRQFTGKYHLATLALAHVFYITFQPDDASNPETLYIF